MKRRILMVLLATGTVVGFSHAAFHAGECRASRKKAFEDHIAEVCVEAARRNHLAP